MVLYIAQKIKNARDTQGLAAAQNIYRSIFVTTTFYAIYKADVDSILIMDGYGDCIVTQ